jgi:hypothetical protein
VENEREREREKPQGAITLASPLMYIETKE